MLSKLFQPVDLAALVFFRIVFGILAFSDVLNTWVYYHFSERSFDPDKFQFYYFGFEWVQPFPEPWMSFFFIVLMAAALAITLGWRYRWACTLFFLGFTYLFLLEKAHYLNHGYLFCWISFVMIWLPADRAFSLRVLRRPRDHRSRIPAWTAFLLPFLMGVVYFFGGIAKLNGDWLRGIPVKFWLQARADMPVLGELWAQPWMAYFISYGGLLLDLFVVFFLLNRRTRIWAFAAVVFFHLTNLTLFSIGIFPFLSVALTAMFFPPDFPRRILRWLEERLGVVRWLRRAWARRWEQAQASKPGPTDEYLWQADPAYRRPIQWGLALLVAVHVLLPLRHHLFPGDVAWSEEGHRYAWRMMLRSKTGYGKFIVVNPSTQDSVRVDPRQELRYKQSRKLFTHPDMILAYAHYLRDRYTEQWDAPAEVYADIMVRLNDGQYAPMVYDTVDLARVEWRFFEPSPWIGPYPGRLKAR